MVAPGAVLLAPSCDSGNTTVASVLSYCAPIAVRYVCFLFELALTRFEYKAGSAVPRRKLLYFIGLSDPDLPDPDLPEPRFTGRINLPRSRKLTVFDPDIPDTPIYRAKPFPPSIPVNRGPTVIG
eukprot:sb/3475626/